MFHCKLRFEHLSVQVPVDTLTLIILVVLLELVAFDVIEALVMTILYWSKHVVQKDALEQNLHPLEQF
jgi:hypothetical protein